MFSSLLQVSTMNSPNCSVSVCSVTSKSVSRAIMRTEAPSGMLSPSSRRTSSFKEAALQLPMLNGSVARL